MRWGAGRWGLTFAASAAIAFGLQACGGEEQTVEFGDAEITIPSDATGSIPDTIRASIVSTVTELGYPDEVIACYERELDAKTDAELLEFSRKQAGLSPEERFDSAGSLRRDLIETCIPKGTEKDIDATQFDDNQVEVSKEALIRRLEAQSNLSANLRDCVVETIRDTPNDDFVDIIQGPGKGIRKFFAEIGRDCALERTE